MIETAAGEPKTGGDVFHLQVWKLFQHLLGRASAGHQVKNIDDADPHPADTWPPPALQGVYGNSISQISHEFVPERSLDRSAPSPDSAKHAPRRRSPSRQHGLASRDGFPSSPGHTLILPRRHVGSFFDLNPDERDDG